MPVTCFHQQRCRFAKHGASRKGDNRLHCTHRVATSALRLPGAQFNTAKDTKHNYRCCTHVMMPKVQSYVGTGLHTAQQHHQMQLT